MVDENLLKEIENFGTLLLSTDEIGIICDLEHIQIKAMKTDKKSPYYIAYKKGVLQTKATIRRSVLEHARNGSSPAQQLAEKYLNELNMEFDE